MRKFIAKALLWQANQAVRKYDTTIILVYGWDWTEGMREGIYNLLKPRANVRRNTSFINWDLGLPLFVLGQQYTKEEARKQLFKLWLRSFIGLAKPRKYKNYLVVSLSAKNINTSNYWLKLNNIRSVIVLPNTKDREDTSKFFLDNLPKGIDVCDLREISTTIPPADLAKSLDVNGLFKFNQIQLQLLYLVKQFADSYSEKFNNEELLVAVSKIDWQANLLQRIKRNISSDKAN